MFWGVMWWWQTIAFILVSTGRATSITVDKPDTGGVGPGLCLPMTWGNVGDTCCWYLSHVARLHETTSHEDLVCLEWTKFACKCALPKMTSNVKLVGAEDQKRASGNKRQCYLEAKWFPSLSLGTICIGYSVSDEQHFSFLLQPRYASPLKDKTETRHAFFLCFIIAYSDVPKELL